VGAQYRLAGAAAARSKIANALIAALNQPADLDQLEQSIADWV
jgi:hypothetical protein